MIEASPPERASRAADPPDAILDACVMIPASVRGLLLSIAEQELFKPAWSDPILAETRGNLIGKGMMGGRQWQHLDQSLRVAFPDAVVPRSNITAIEGAMPNHPKDRHVLAAAVASGAPVVVTNNLRDFRQADLAKVGVRAAHPDAYLSELLQRSPYSVALGINAHLQTMAPQTRWTPGQLLGHLKGMGSAAPLAPRFAARAEQTLRIHPTAPPVRSDRSRGAPRGRTRPGPDLSR